ncbi:MAG: bifunctional phosphopantothenoylcysteine decarboxylase/phosphopantothenate--cysteine ligase CoaBC [Halobacteriales archaeon]
MLDGVNVALGVTGSIAAVRTVELAHELRRWGADVRAVMTDAASGIVHPWALEFATGSPPVTALTGAVEHVELCGRDGWADVLLIAPATANTVGKLAAAIDDTPVTTTATTAIGAGLPLVIAPAMHEPMYDHPTVAENLERLQSRHEAVVVPPRLEEGKAKIAAAEAIALGVARAVRSAPLAGRHVAVSAGATAEAIDPIRVITTRASGRTGRAVAKGLYALGAEVTLLQADGDERAYAEVVPVETAEAMREAAVDLADEVDAYVAAAAVSDFVPTPREEKIPSGAPLELTFEPTAKVIGAVRDVAPSLPIVGFKAETAAADEALVDSARELLAANDLAFVVANDASVMGAVDTRVLVVDRDDTEELAGSKRAVGLAVAERLAAELDSGTK